MISVLNDIPENVAGFRATGTVTRKDFENIVVPVTELKLAREGHINFLLIVDTDLGNFTPGAWLQDALLGLEHLTKWRKAAIVIDNENVIKFTNGFSVIIPGEFKGFQPVELATAVKWVAE